jgi:hypothetical protein
MKQVRKLINSFSSVFLPDLWYTEERMIWVC